MAIGTVDVAPREEIVPAGTSGRVYTASVLQLRLEPGEIEEPATFALWTGKPHHSNLAIEGMSVVALAPIPAGEAQSIWVRNHRGASGIGYKVTIRAKA